MRRIRAKIKITTIEDFILFVETVERQYPSAGPKEVASEIRQLWYSDANWEVMVASQGITQVRATGPRTEMGKIGKALQVLQIEETNLQQQTGKIVSGQAQS